MTQRKSPFDKPPTVTAQYERELRKIAREVGRIIKGYQYNALENIGLVQRSLLSYAEILKPWALLKGKEVAEQTDRQDFRAWAQASENLSTGIRTVLRRTNVGRVFREVMTRQVELITSLPTDAGKRVHKLVIEGMENSQRAEAISHEIARSGEVTESRAMLIARTETTRAATEFMRARAEAIGSTKYIWRTARDSNVRPSHRKLEGKVFSWDNPPECDPGYHANPGCIFNCRCYAEPII